MLFVILAGAIVAADQITKFLVRINVSPGESIHVTGPVYLTYTTNKAGAFGFFSNQSFLLGFAAIIAVVVILLYLRFSSARSLLLKIGLGLELGGAIGNLIDRFRLGSVTDFIDLTYWPVFNLADSAITVGAILIVFYLLFSTRKKVPSRDEPKV